MSEVQKEDVAGGATLLLILLISYLTWCAFNSTSTGTWSWTPWKSISRIKRTRILPPPEKFVLARDNSYDNPFVQMIMP
jgi:hypothetical protein